MANLITGDFDVVVQASLAAIDRVLAALHQTEKFLHSFSTRVNDIPPASKIGDITRLPVKLVAEPMRIEEKRAPARLSLVPPPPILTKEGQVAPARVQTSGTTYSVGTASEQVYRAYGALLDTEEYTGVRGYLEVQVSTPTITLPSNSASRVTIHYTVMIHYLADAGTPVLPEFLHGEIQATVDVAQVAWQSGHVLDIDFTAHDIDVTFNPFWTDPALTPGQLALINKIIRNVLRTRFDPTQAMLPQGIEQMHFKTMPNAGQPAVAMLLDLRPDASPNPDPGSVTQVFLGSGDDFAIGIGRDYIIATIQRLAGQHLPTLKYTACFLWVCNTWDVSFSIGVDLLPGQILLTIQVYAKSEGFLSDQSWTVTQGLDLTLINGSLALTFAGDPDVNSSGLASFANGAIKNYILQHRDALLQPAQQAIQSAFDPQKNLGAVFQALKAPAQLAYESVDVQPDGVILHGALSVPAWDPVHVDSSGGNVMVQGVGTQIELNALNSWIPGGSITDFTWTISGHLLPVHEQHRFVTRVAGDLTTDSIQWCLDVSGNRITAAGAPAQQPTRGETPNCKVTSLIGAPVAAHFPFDIRLPISLVDRSRVPGPGPVSSPIADIDPWVASLGASNDGTNLLVYFGDAEFNSTLELIREALQASQKAESAIMLVAVLPAEEAARMPQITIGAHVNLGTTEDHEGNWRKTFEVRERPVMIIVNSEGKSVWRHVGRIEAKALTAALNEHLRSGGRLRQRQLRIAPQEGDLAPDFLFEYAGATNADAGRARYMSLHDLRGLPVQLVFWTAWSKPSIAELEYLQRARHEPVRGRPLILAINDGDERGTAVEVFERNRLAFQLVVDRERQIARRYAIGCWPTRIAIDVAGRVSSIHFGVTPGEERFRNG